MPGSGKSLAADIIARHLKAFVFHSGDIIREEIAARGLPYTPETDREIARWFHTRGRERLLAERVWQKVKGKDIVVLEGFRSKQSVARLEELSRTKPVILAITVPFKIRAARELARGRFGKAETLSYLRARDRLEVAHGLRELIKAADYKIDNSGTKRQLEKALITLAKASGLCKS
jgi:dephospho-CoA kinase